MILKQARFVFLAYNVCGQNFNYHTSALNYFEIKMFNHNKQYVYSKTLFLSQIKAAWGLYYFQQVICFITLCLKGQFKISTWLIFQSNHGQMLNYLFLLLQKSHLNLTLIHDLDMTLTLFVVKLIIYLLWPKYFLVITFFRWQEENLRTFLLWEQTIFVQSTSLN